MTTGIRAPLADLIRQRISALEADNERLRAAIIEARRSTHPSSPAYRVLTYALETHDTSAPVVALKAVR